MKKYEYKLEVIESCGIDNIDDLKKEYKRIMNSFGAEGWEAIQHPFLTTNHGKDSQIIQMRREIP